VNDLLTRNYALAALVIGLAAGCGGGSSNSDSNPNPVTTNGMVSYAQDVQSIFNASCALSGCHAGPQPSGLDLRASVSYSKLVNQPATASCGSQVAGAILVKPGDTSGSMLWRKLANDPGKCGGAMPLGTSGLIAVSRSSFDTIENWIQQGPVNN